MQPQNTVPDPERMFQMIAGFWLSCAIYVAAKLSIPDLLAKNPKTATQLAAETNTHAPSLYRLLRTLASVDIFSENDQGEFELTPFGSLLRDDMPGSLRPVAIMNLEHHYSAWGNLLQAVKTGEPAFDNLHRMSIWEYYEAHPEGGANFNRSMAGITQGILRSVLPAYDFTQFPLIVDVGGGNGALLCAILKTAVNSKGIVYDFEGYTKDQASKLIKENNLTERCSFEPGDFFKSVPAGASAYLMKSVLHDWDDEHSRRILDNLQKAMPAGSKLLIIDRVIPEDNLPHPGKFMDLNMLVMTGGRERTATEWKKLVEQSGLKLSRIISTDSPMSSIVEVVKA